MPPAPERADSSSCSVASVLAWDLSKRNNLVALDDDTVAVAAGGVLLIIHLPTMSQRHLQSLEGGAIGAVTVHPQRTCFAVAEACRDRAPNM